MTSAVCTHVLNCHRGQVKRIASENSDYHFLTVSEASAVLNLYIHVAQLPTRMVLFDSTICERLIDAIINVPNAPHL